MGNLDKHGLSSTSNGQAEDMKRIILVAAIVLGIAGGVEAAEPSGGFTPYGSVSCAEYLDDYSRLKLTGGGKYSGPVNAFGSFDWLNGFISGINHEAKNGKKDIFEGMTPNGIKRWIASWCRDNPSRNVIGAVYNLRKTRR
jgi:hypothetical protein